ncbi:hypothetical protein BGW80DRAFT_605912 [Lactifluus volemus]|nr:hypothetical protein BGW80DRAFT_605912 [Lactifluus volemus]
MSVHPLPGASYHTIDTVPLFDIDLEAEASPHFNLPEKNIYTSKERLPLLDQIPSSRTVRRHAPPVMLVLLMLCCLAFVVSAYAERAANHLLLCEVSATHAHAWLPNHVSAAFRSQSYGTSVRENIDGALEILEQQNRDGSRVEGHQADLREYLRQTFPLANFSLHWTYVGQLAVILHWQGTDHGLKPVSITNSDDVGSQNPGISSAYAHVSTSDHTSSYGEDETEHGIELAGVESSVCILTAIEALIRSGHQPSRTLVFSLMLGKASDAPQMSQYLHAMYEEQGLLIGFKSPVPECKTRRIGLLHY